MLPRSVANHDAPGSKSPTARSAVAFHTCHGQSSASTNYHSRRRGGSNAAPESAPRWRVIHCPGVSSSHPTSVGKPAMLRVSTTDRTTDGTAARTFPASHGLVIITHSRILRPSWGGRCEATPDSRHHDGILRSMLPLVLRMVCIVGPLAVVLATVPGKSPPTPSVGPQVAKVQLCSF